MRGGYPFTVSDAENSLEACDQLALCCEEACFPVVASNRNDLLALVKALDAGSLGAGGFSDIQLELEQAQEKSSLR